MKFATFAPSNGKSYFWWPRKLSILFTSFYFRTFTICREKWPRYSQIFADSTLLLKIYIFLVKFSPKIFLKFLWTILCTIIQHHNCISLHFRTYNKTHFMLKRYRKWSYLDSLFAVFFAQTKGYPKSHLTKWTPKRLQTASAYFFVFFNKGSHFYFYIDVY